MSQGDKNTRYFHTTSLVRRKHNKIEALQNKQGEVVTKPEVLKQMTVEFYRDLYSSAGPCPRYHVRGKFPMVDERFLQRIQRALSAEEIKCAIFSMGALKAPGPDGLNPLFFQSQWDVVGKSVVELLLQCCSNSSRERD